MKIQKPRLGFIGWRGMVGSVLLERMLKEGDLEHFNLTFFSSSSTGKPVPNSVDSYAESKIIQDSYNLEQLRTVDIILTTQGGEYSKKILPELRNLGWKGFWIDAASTFRMQEDARIVLDPLNRSALIEDIKKGIKTFAGANCSTATLLMGLAGLFQEDLIEWVSFMSYQSISGAGAQALSEFIAQNKYLSTQAPTGTASALEQEILLSQALHHPDFPKTSIGYPLASNILPWIDNDIGDGASREEKKTMAETHKILGIHSANSNMAIDGTCVRVGVFRSHSFGCTVRLKQLLPLETIQKLIAEAHPWAKIIANTKEATLEKLTPATASHSLDVYIGRLRKTRIDDYTLNAFIITDQLLWGAAEPLRRMLNILLEVERTLPTLFESTRNTEQSPQQSLAQS